MTRRKLRRLRPYGRRGLRLVRRHYVTLMSFLVLSTVAATALTSHQFDVANGSATEDVPAEGRTSLSQTVLSSRTTTPSPIARPLALVYLVSDETRASKLDLTHSSLVWDTARTDPDYDTRTPPIHVLVAGTRTEESEAIQKLNVLIGIADLQGLDLRVVDLRDRN